MRIAVVQLAIDPCRRTLTFQRALEAINTAAETDPAPDLVLLPAFSDVAAIMTGNEEMAERPAGQTVAACGHLARHWGVFVALGFAERGPAGLFVTGSLLDNDGDLCLTQRQRKFRSRTAACFAAGDDVSVADVLLGRIAILVGDDVLDGKAWAAASRAGAGMILGTACWGQGRGGGLPDLADACGQIAEHARHFGLCCAVADVTTADADSALCCPGMSGIVEAGGQILAAAETGKASIVWGNLELPEAPSVECDEG